MSDKETHRHFVFWAKGKYYKDKTLSDMIAKITGSPCKYVSDFNKVYWLKNACIDYGITGYEIIDLFVKKSGALYTDYENEIDQLIDVMRIKLQLLQVRENGKELLKLGEPDLFEGS